MIESLSRVIKLMMVSFHAKFYDRINTEETNSFGTLCFFVTFLSLYMSRVTNLPNCLV